MARRRKRRRQNSFEYGYVVVALLLLVLPILGFGFGSPLGPVGEIVKKIAVFLVGMYYWLFLILVFLIGVYLLFKKELPSTGNAGKIVGIIIFILGLLAFSHLSYIEKGSTFDSVLSATWENLNVVFKAINESKPFNASGAGILGCLVVCLFNLLFDKTGTMIVSIVFMVAGFSFFTGFSIVDFLKTSVEEGKEKILKNKDKKDKEKEESPLINGIDEKKPVIINDNNASKEEQPKLVVSSIEELEKMNNEVKEEKSDIEKFLTEDYGDDDNENKPKPVINHNYKLPTLDLLNKPKKSANKTDNEQIERNINTLEVTLREFGIIGKVVEVNKGPAVTQYEMEIQKGTKLSKLLSINKEISLALAKKDVRIEAPIPGKSTVGVEIPNDSIDAVSLREILENIPENKVKSKLLVALGKNIMGKSKFCEIDKTPHLLVAGATGSGKSVCINCIICSILMRTKPDEVKIVLVDPKKVELSNYNGVPHLLMPVVNDPKKASVALQRIVNEMENRYDIFSEKNVKNIAGYNEWVEKENQVRADEDKIPKMPYIVVIVDELADLMLVASKEVEDSIMRITQMARAAGIHLIIATQRPSVDVITGVVKSNIPSRISFAVSSQIDSRTILDMSGAEKLLGKGDMLFLPMGEGTPERIQGAYVSDEEIARIIDYTVKQQVAQYDEKWTNLDAAKDQGNAGGEVEVAPDDGDDDLYNDVVEFVITSGKASASLLQRRFKIGYNRAARLVDLLEERGIIGPQNGSKPREVLVKLDNNIGEE